MTESKQAAADLDLALIGNCQYSALVSGRGRVVWTCFPRFDSPPVFAELVDERVGGHWTIEGDGEGWRTEARYVENTCVLRTHWVHETGQDFEVYDFAPRFFQNDRYYRPTMLARIVRLGKGRPRIRVVCRPRFAFGLRDPRIIGGSNHLTYQDPESTDRMRLTTNASITRVIEGTPFELNSDLHFALAWDEPFEDSFHVLDGFLLRTVAYWRRWCKHTRVPVNYQEAVLRAAMTLKLHTFEDTGAVIAATTTSIPEAPGTQRNWDYRYCWLRDAAFVIRALLQIGHTEEAAKFCDFLRNLLPTAANSGFSLQPVYGIDGRPGLAERELEHLSGYRGNAPVREGNAAYTHVQNDVYGEVILALAPLFYDARLLEVEVVPVYDAIEHLVDACMRTFLLKDAGIWEYRDAEAHHVFSKLMAWVGVDRARRIAEHSGRIETAQRWGTAAEEMKQEILACGFSEEVGSFVGSYGAKELDASVLLMSVLGFLPEDDPRLLSTLDVMRARLCEGNYMFRYRHDDGLGRQHSAFTICATWMVEALWLSGRREEAVAMFDHLLAARNSFGLLSEDIDPTSGELWGNYPQTYSMLGIINCAVRLSPRWGEMF